MEAVLEEELSEELAEDAELQIEALLDKEAAEEDSRGQRAHRGQLMRHAERGAAREGGAVPRRGRRVRPRGAPGRRCPACPPRRPGPRSGVPPGRVTVASSRASSSSTAAAYSGRTVSRRCRASRAGAASTWIETAPYSRISVIADRKEVLPAARGHHEAEPAVGVAELAAAGSGRVSSRSARACLRGGRAPGRPSSGRSPPARAPGSRRRP